MYASYHEINDNNTYSLSELYDMDRFSNVCELVRYHDMVDMPLVAPIDDDAPYHLVGYLTECLPEDGCVELTLIVKQDSTPNLSYDDMVSRFVTR